MLGALDRLLYAAIDVYLEMVHKTMEQVYSVYNKVADSLIAVRKDQVELAQIRQEWEALPKCNTTSASQKRLLSLVEY